MEENGKKQQEHRMTTVEITQRFILKELKEIKDNHLKSIYKKLDRLQWLLITGMLSIITSLIVLILRS